MQFQTGYLYHLISGGILVLGAFLIWFIPSITNNLDPDYRNIAGWMVLLWGGFRLFNGYVAFRRKQRDEKE